MTGRASALVFALVVSAACTGGGAAPTEPPGEPSPTATAQPSRTEAPAASPVAPPTAPASAEPSVLTTPAPEGLPTAAPATSAGLGSGPLAWTELSVAGGPSAREDHTFTLDGAGKAAYLFGGRAGRRVFDDLWRYDLAQDSWQLLEVAGERPAARFGHVAVWVEGQGLVVWSGQQTGDTFFADIWAFEPAAGEWRQLPDGGDVPPARYGSCGAVGPDGRLWISHGFTADTGRFFDTRAYDFAALSWSDMTPDGDLPVVRCLHDCLWTPGGELVLYAGQTTGAPAIGDLWRYSAASGEWAEADRPAAEPRQLYALAQLAGTAFVFGGGGADGELLDDLWLLDLASLQMTPAQVAGSGPPARFGASLVADRQRDRLLLFGGKGRAGELADLWQLAADSG